MSQESNCKLRAVTITLNPALDLTGHLNNLEQGKVNVAETGTLHPAGKGINVAKVLAQLGADMSVTGFLGQDNRGTFTSYFEQLSINDQFVTVSGATRINVKLVDNDHQNEVTDINFPGVSVTQQDIDQLTEIIEILAKNHDLFVIAGSLPTGMTPDDAALIIANLKAKGKKVVFDSSKIALQAGVLEKPWLIKPNDDELAQLAGHSFDSEQALFDYAQSLNHQGIDNVVLSLGEKGCGWFKDGSCLTARPPRMDVVSTVGAGDTLVAGLCWGELNGWSQPRTLQFSTALSALAVTQVGVGISDLNAVKTLQTSVKLS
ncbi:1-phosphofructokinase [Vibrio sp. SS-MA-C1-2]|uniref:1-phosphofructokinase n=1 Tax=Vibrio sp. SS-MA-C1-2 TaxID=2908646 RepID=UPI001F394F55|nr:1-phosphofructokinase [Vibrio sp. SS-MA-C1-2]UJF18137.1 1-phosphofructokinase [Vibrio sp. SS-MA-C1-2]